MEGETVEGECGGGECGWGRGGGERGEFGGRPTSVKQRLHLAASMSL